LHERIKNPSIFQYRIDNICLKKVEQIKDLGIIFDSKLTFVPHINEITNKAMKCLGFILRTVSDFKYINSYKLLFTGLVRSNLEYNSTIWAPFYNIHIHKIERVQHKFLRYVNYKLCIPIQDLNYTFLMDLLNLTDLSVMRTVSDLVCLFNIANGRLDALDLTNLITLRVPTRSTQLTALYNVPWTINNYFQNSPVQRLHRLGNKYSSIDVYCFDTVSKLKTCLFECIR